MRRKIISKIEFSIMISIFLISFLQIILFPLIKNKFRNIVFTEIPVERIGYVLNRIDSICKKEKVVKAPKTSFISLVCEKISND